MAVARATSLACSNGTAAILVWTASFPRPCMVLRYRIRKEMRLSNVCADHLETISVFDHFNLISYRREKAFDWHSTD